MISKLCTVTDNEHVCARVFNNYLHHKTHRMTFVCRWHLLDVWQIVTDQITQNDNFYIILFIFSIHFAHVSTFIPFLCMVNKCWMKVTAVDISVMGKNKRKARRKERGRDSCHEKWIALCRCGDVEQREETADCKKDRSSAKTTTHTYSLNRTMLVLIIVLESIVRI